MPNVVTQLSPHIEEMRTKLSQTAPAERSLVQTLSDELKRFDQQILPGIRTVTAEHEARRSGILNELQALASSIGAFLPERAAPQAIEQRSEAPDTPSPGRPRISYHEELEADLHALLHES